MEFSDAEEINEREDIENSLQTMSIQTPSSDPSASSVKEQEPGRPNEALFLALAYLPLYELLAMREVCSSLRDAVTTDILPWLDIVVDKPLNMRLTDEILMRVTSKANGRLRSLAAINCSRITDLGLQLVIEKNPFIKKLSVPGCTGLTPQGIIKALEKLSENNRCLDSLHINGIYNITKEHLRTLHSFLKLNSALQNQKKEPRILYHQHRNYSLLAIEEGNPSIDVEICPRCNEVGMVFDCSRETCRRKLPAVGCRGCCHCIPRCAECGRCIESDEMEDAVCNDNLCPDCWLQLPKCNLCNRPYCKQHANMGCNSSGSTGFVCHVCRDPNQKFYHIAFIQ